MVTSCVVLCGKPVKVGLMRQKEAPHEGQYPGCPSRRLQYSKKTNGRSYAGGFNVVADHSDCRQVTWKNDYNYSLPPLGRRMRVQLLFVSLTAPRANTAVMSWGERGLITECSVLLPVPLGEPYTLNWTEAPRELNCRWDRPLNHENSIINQKTSYC